MVEPVSNSNSLLKRTAVAAGIGAGTYAVGSYALQKFAMKSPYLSADTFNSAASIYDGLKNSFKNPILNKISNAVLGFSSKITRMAGEAVKTGKVNFKLMGIYAGIGAATFAGMYLAYRGVKALFSKNA